MDDGAKAKFINALRLAAPKSELLLDAPMSRYTSLKLGGPAEILLDVSGEDRVAEVLRIAARHGVPVRVIGNGTNLLVMDGGIRGLTLRIADRFADISKPATTDGKSYTLTAQAGAAMTALANAAADAGLTGLEFAAGIPGTVGGGVRMNAGAYGGEIGDAVVGVACVTRAGEMKTYGQEELQFGYRSSSLTDEIVLYVTVLLQKSREDTVRVAMRELNARRRDKQPLTLPCCGSTFKRPPGRFAGELIESCGLKGYRIGGASVSEKHANFLVNDQNGTAAEYLALVRHVQRVVREQTGIELTPEVQIIGEEP